MGRNSAAFASNTYALDMGVSAQQAKTIEQFIKQGKAVTLVVRPYWKNGRRDTNMQNIEFLVDAIQTR